MKIVRVLPCLPSSALARFTTPHHISRMSLQQVKYSGFQTGKISGLKINSVGELLTLIKL